MGMPIYRPCMANNPAGTKLGAASHPQILSLGVVPVKGGRSVQRNHEFEADKRCFSEHCPTVRIQELRYSGRRIIRSAGDKAWRKPVYAIRRPLQEGQTPRPLQQAIGGSCFRRSDPAGIGRGEWSGRAGVAGR